MDSVETLSPASSTPTTPTTAGYATGSIGSILNQYFASPSSTTSTPTTLLQTKIPLPKSLDDGGDGGYDVDLVDQDYLPPDLKCAVCWKLMRDPVQLGCGHGYCSSCLNNFKKRSARSAKISCPTCRTPVNFKKVFDNKMLKRYISSLRVKCKNAHRGCKWEGEVGNMESRLCDQELVACSRCGAEVERNMMSQHYSSPSCLNSKEKELSSRIEELKELVKELENKNEELEISVCCKESTITKLNTDMEAIQTSNHFLIATQNLMKQEIDTLRISNSAATFDDTGNSNHLDDAATAGVLSRSESSSEHQDLIEELFPHQSLITTQSPILRTRTIGAKSSYTNSDLSPLPPNRFITSSEDVDDTIYNDQTGYNISPAEDRTFSSKSRDFESDLTTTASPSKRARHDSTFTSETYDTGLTGGGDRQESFNEFLNKCISRWPSVVTPVSNCSVIVGPATHSIIDLTDSIAESPDPSLVIDLTDSFVGGSTTTDCAVISTGSFVGSTDSDVDDGCSTNSFINSTTNFSVNTSSSGNLPSLFVGSTSPSASTVSCSSPDDSGLRSVGLTYPFADSTALNNLIEV